MTHTTRLVTRCYSVLAPSLPQPLENRLTQAQSRIVDLEANEAEARASVQRAKDAVASQAAAEVRGNALRNQLLELTTQHEIQTRVSRWGCWGPGKIYLADTLVWLCRSLLLQPLLI